jgi:hypothetical protein
VVPDKAPEVVIPAAVADQSLDHKTPAIDAVEDRQEDGYVEVDYNYLANVAKKDTSTKEGCNKMDFSRIEVAHCHDPKDGFILYVPLENYDDEEDELESA